jgi:hypothetical protein
VLYKVLQVFFRGIVWMAFDTEFVARMNNAGFQDNMVSSRFRFAWRKKRWVCPRHQDAVHESQAFASSAGDKASIPALWHAGKLPLH